MPWTRIGRWPTAGSRTFIAMTKSLSPACVDEGSRDVIMPRMWWMTHRHALSHSLSLCEYSCVEVCGRGRPANLGAPGSTPGVTPTRDAGCLGCFKAAPSFTSSPLSSPFLLKKGRNARLQALCFILRKWCPRGRWHVWDPLAVEPDRGPRARDLNLK